MLRKPDGVTIFLKDQWFVLKWEKVLGKRNKGEHKVDLSWVHVGWKLYNNNIANLIQTVDQWFPAEMSTLISKSTESSPLFPVCLCGTRLFLESLWQQMKAWHQGPIQSLKVNWPQCQLTINGCFEIVLLPFIIQCALTSQIEGSRFSDFLLFFLLLLSIFLPFHYTTITEVPPHITKPCSHQQNTFCILKERLCPHKEVKWGGHNPLGFLSWRLELDSCVGPLSSIFIYFFCT